MEVFQDYAFVVNGKKRKEVVKLLEHPRTPTELSKMAGVNANVITRILKELASRNLVESHKLTRKKKTYRLTKKGELARQILDNLIEPKNLQELLKLLKTHRNVVVHIIRQMIQNGFITLFKTAKPARKFYQLTRKGEEVRGKLESENQE